MGAPRADIQPELWVGHGPAAVAFYEQAFGASVEHRVSGPAEDDVVAQLSVAGARFWVSSASDELHRFDPSVIGGATGRVLLVVDDPESLMRAAVAAGATEKSPVGDEHGWRLGRLVRCGPRVVYLREGNGIQSITTTTLPNFDPAAKRS